MHLCILRTDGNSLIGLLCQRYNMLATIHNLAFSFLQTPLFWTAFLSKKKSKAINTPPGNHASFLPYQHGLPPRHYIIWPPSKTSVHPLCGCIILEMLFAFTGDPASRLPTCPLSKALSNNMNIEIR